MSTNQEDAIDAMRTIVNGPAFASVREELARLRRIEKAALDLLEVQPGGAHSRAFGAALSSLQRAMFTR